MNTPKRLELMSAQVGGLRGATTACIMSQTFKRKLPHGAGMHNCVFGVSTYVGTRGTVSGFNLDTRLKAKLKLKAQHGCAGKSGKESVSQLLTSYAFQSYTGQLPLKS